MGAGSDGQLGTGHYGHGNRPEQSVASGVIAIAAGGWHSLLAKTDGSLWAVGSNSYGQLGDGGTTHDGTNRPEQIVAGPPGYNRISAQLLDWGDISLSYIGMAGTNYALDRSFSLMPANRLPLVTNPADPNGTLVLTNTPDSTTNNFWRIRSVP